MTSPAPFTTSAAPAVIEALSPAQTVALTMWAEARARLDPRRGWVQNPLAAMADVANVIMNRARDPRWRELGVKGTCLAHAQFSCWLQTPGNFDALILRAQDLLAGDEGKDTLPGCLEIAGACVDGTMIDRLDGATHYYATWMTPPPRWARPPARFVVERFGHRFYTGVL